MNYQIIIVIISEHHETMDSNGYLLEMAKSLLLKIAIDLVSFPIKNCDVPCLSSKTEFFFVVFYFQAHC